MQDSGYKEKDKALIFIPQEQTVYTRGGEPKVMQKNVKKVVNVLSTAALAASLTVPFAANEASAASSNRVATVPVVSDDATGVDLGVLTISEESGFVTDFVYGKSFLLTLPTGVAFANNLSTTVQDLVYYNNNPIAASQVVKNGDNSVIVTFDNTTATAAQDKLEIRPKVDIDGAAAGNIELTVDAFDSGVTGGKYTIGVVASGATTAILITSVPTVGDVATGATISLTENSLLALGTSAQEITLKLPKGFKWDTAGTKVTFLAGLSATPTPTITTSSDNTLKVQFTPAAARTQRGIIQIVPAFTALDNAKYGDVEVEITGDEVAAANLVIAKYSDFGVSVTAGDAKEITAGQFTQKTATIKIQENVDNSIIGNRKTTVELPENVIIESVEVTSISNLGNDSNGNPWTTASFQTYLNGLIDGKSNEFEFVMPDGNGKTKVEFKLNVSVDASTSGDIKAKITGRQGIEGEVLVAKALAPATVTAATQDLVVGKKGQAIGDIVIAETKAEMIQAGDLVLTLPSGIKWADAKVEVIEGNLEIDADDVDLNSNVMTIKVKDVSTKASKIKISGATVSLDRTIPEGAVKVSVGGSAVVGNDEAQNGADNSGSTTTLDKGEFEENTIASVQVANVVTPAPGVVKATAVFTLDKAEYTVNGVTKTADVAPYLKNNRTYVPVRYVAEALGVTSDNIIWNEADRTVTLLQGDKVVQLKVGSKTMLVNGVAIVMDVAPEITNSRTFLPFRFIAQALGAEVKWDEATKTVTVDKKN